MEAKKRRLLTIREASKIIDGLTEYRIRQMCATNQLPHFKAGNRVLIAEDNLFKVIFGEEPKNEE